MHSICFFVAGQEWEGLSIGSLLPGMLVNARVRNVLADGLLVSFLTYFNGTVDCFHLSQVDTNTFRTPLQHSITDICSQVHAGYGYALPQ